ncbi:MAG: hypothetical protein PUC47_11190 [Oscillospiraceae bacterium]|nr:hypothetical protein [Oscillospiraceae bacterium]
MKKRIRKKSDAMILEERRRNLVDPGDTTHRHALLRWLMDRGASSSTMLEILSPMESMTNEQKEAFAARLLKELQSGENPFFAD